MGKILDTVKNQFVEDDWHFSESSDRNMITAGVAAGNANYQMIVDVDEEDEHVLLLLFCPIRVPPEKRLIAAEYLTRANYGLRFGCFEMDMGDGEVRYKVSMTVEGGTLSPEMVQHMIGAGVGTMARYFPGLSSICISDQSALDAVLELERSLMIRRRARAVSSSSN